MGPSLGKPSSYYLLISRVLVKLSPIRFRAFMSALICYPFTPSSPGTLKLRCGGQFGSDGSPVVSRSLLPRLASGNTKYRSQLYTESTKATNKTHRDTYSRFSLYMGYTPVPVQPDDLLQYAAFLARSPKAASVRSYMNIVGIPHKEFGQPNLLLDNWPLKSEFKGLTKSQKHPHLALYAPWSRVPNRFFGIRDWACLKAGILNSRRRCEGFTRTDQYQHPASLQQH